MKSFEYFLKPSLEIKHLNRRIQELPVQVYAVDKPCGDEEIMLKDQFQMGHFHSCDYILVKEKGDKVLLIEDSNLKEGKKDLEEEYLRFMRREDEQTKEKLLEKVMERIRDEQRLKAYASLLLLCLLTSKDKRAKKLIGKGYPFLGYSD